MIFTETCNYYYTTV